MLDSEELDRSESGRPVTEELGELREELQQWQRCWNDPLLLLRRAYQLLQEQAPRRLTVLTGVLAWPLLRDLTSPISPWW